jgi:hypothetical protein
MMSKWLMRRRSSFLSAFFAAVVALGALPMASKADGGGWETIGRDDGILVQRKEVGGSPFVAFRGEGDVDAPLLLVGSVLVDAARSREWVDSVVEAHVLRRVSETEYITYAHVGTPITMADRDFVTDVVLAVDGVNKTFTMRMHSVDDPAAPKTDYVRGDLREGSWVLTAIDGGSRTHVATEIHCDPKGSIAPWIVNFFQNNWGHNTLMSLRKQVAKRDIAVDPRLKAALVEDGFFAPRVSSP